MKLKDYVKNLIELIAARPETAEFDVVTSKDDEGNGFNLVLFDPQVGRYGSGEFEDEEEFEEEVSANAVCVN